MRAAKYFSNGKRYKKVGEKKKEKYKKSLTTSQ